MNLIIRLFALLLIASSLLLNAMSERSYIVTINDQKDYKKLLRVHKNVLILFSNSSMDKNSQLKKVIKVTTEAAKQAVGQGTVAQINCNDGETKKLCKKLKLTPKPYILKHYQNGEFHKDYDRKINTKSIYRFLLDPTGDIPWDEDPTAVNVVHLDNSNALQKIVSSGKPVLIMFYAPWCGFCKRLKPEFSAAADQLKGKIVLAGMDLTYRGNEVIAKQFSIDGYPTLEYFEDGIHKFRYKGQNSKDGIIEWLKNPVEQDSSLSPEEEEISWAETITEVVLLSDETFDEFVAEHRSVLVLIYAPCIHCKMVKPEFIRAADRLKRDGIDGVLAAVDATTNIKIAERYKVEGYPTFAYFKDGKFAWKINERREDGFYNFMKNPVEPSPPELSWSKQSDGVHVLHLTAENFKTEVKKKKHALIIFYAPWCGYCKRAKPKFFEAAKILADDTRIVLGAVDCTTERSLCQEYKIEGFPTIIYLSYGKNRIDYSGKYETASFINFVESGGQISEYRCFFFRSQNSVPEFDFGNVVIVLDENNFDKIISSGNVFVMFFSPLCKHCKTVKSEFREAAKQSHFGKFAVVDCTAWNDLCERHGVKGYPTFRMFVNGVQHDYNGNHTSSDFTTAFMKIVASTKIDL
uniref:Thioredoxin domain-containing protein n=2 Tax=Wuchereria bancrofti TaxID=6293 RepID=A0AAF5PVN3_WUCBA